MGTMVSYQISEFGGRVEPVWQPIPEPVGREALLRSPMPGSVTPTCTSRTDTTISGTGAG